MCEGMSTRGYECAKLRVNEGREINSLSTSLYSSQPDKRIRRRLGRLGLGHR